MNTENSFQPLQQTLTTVIQQIVLTDIKENIKLI